MGDIIYMDEYLKRKQVEKDADDEACRNPKHLGVILCGKPGCKVSTGIHGGYTFGKGELDANGYWEFPCDECVDMGPCT